MTKRSRSVILCGVALLVGSLCGCTPANTNSEPEIQISSAISSDISSNIAPETAVDSASEDNPDFDYKGKDTNFTLVRHISDAERHTAYYPTAKDTVKDEYYDIGRIDIDYLTVFGTDIMNNDTVEITGNGHKIECRDDSQPVFTDRIELNGNKPIFTIDFLDLLQDDNAPYEYYSDLDDLNRCGTAYAVICKDIMPADDETRGEIGAVKPSGWQTQKYDKDVISDLYLYNRSHLIGWQLAAENANEKNLVTGSRFMNVVGMLPYENQVKGYLDANPENHVLYQVTPVFANNNLVCYGVVMSALSCEDYGEGVSYCVFCPNVQPKVRINYTDGSSEQDNSLSWYSEEDIPSAIHETEHVDSESYYEQNAQAIDAADCEFVVNENSKKFHLPSCSDAVKISEKNRRFSNQTQSELEAEGYSPCKKCIG